MNEIAVILVVYLSVLLLLSAAALREQGRYVKSLQTTRDRAMEGWSVALAGWRRVNDHNAELLRIIDQIRVQKTEDAQ